MKSGRLAAWAVAVAALPVLAACGGSSGGSSSAGNQPTSAAPPSSSAPSSSSAPQTPAPSPSEAGGSSATTAGGLTPPGTHLGLGQQAVVGWDPEDTGGKSVFKMAVTVLSIQKGSIADFKNIQLNAKEKTATPYYVTVRIKALGSNPPSGDHNPAIFVNGVDDRGQQQESVTFLGTFQRCDDPEAPAPFTAGKSYTACLTYLMPAGGSIKSMSWTQGPHKKDDVTAYFEKPIVWGAS